MNCENDLCVYRRNRSCILDEISIDGIGMCSECIRVDIDEDIIEKARQEFLSQDCFEK